VRFIAGSRCKRTSRIVHRLSKLRKNKQNCSPIIIITVFVIYIFHFSTFSHTMTNGPHCYATLCAVDLFCRNIHTQSITIHKEKIQLEKVEISDQDLSVEIPGNAKMSFKRRNANNMSMSTNRQLQHSRPGHAEPSTIINIF